MSKPEATIKRLDSKHRQEIEAAITDGIAKGKLSGDAPASEILEALDKAYFELQIAERLNPLVTAKDRKRWTRILNLFDKLASELDEAKDYWFFQRPPVTEPVPDVRNMKAKNAASYAQELQAMKENCRRHLESISTVITARRGRGRADQAREIFYQAVLDAWEHGGGKRTRPTKESGGPLWRFFHAVVEPIFTADTPALTSFEAIVERGLPAKPSVSSLGKAKLDADRQ
jgi:hypothetical protein